MFQHADLDWETEGAKSALPRLDRVAQERLIGVLEVERSAIWANLLLWAVMLVATLNLPDPTLTLAALGSRIAAMAVTHPAFGRLRKMTAEGIDCTGRLGFAMLALFLGGVSWALILASLYIDPVVHLARGVIAGGTMVAVALVTSLLAPVKRLSAAFAAGFTIALAVFVLLQGAIVPLHGLVALFSIMLVVGIYGNAVAMREKRAARMLVENRMLSDELAISLAKAEYLANRDPLTGLMNRRALFDYAENQDGDLDAQILTIDLDHFKQVNDRFGHAVGDEVLVGVARAIRETVSGLPPGKHLLVRLGGEEFAVVIDHADPALAAKAANRLRQAVEKVSDPIEADGLETSASIGVGSWNDGQSLDEALNAADRALYRAKARGRNRVVVEKD
ncbi:MAG: GGDEF domain-containing protein [Erythrobacter sp.]